MDCNYTADSPSNPLGIDGAAGQQAEQGGATMCPPLYANFRHSKTLSRSLKAYRTYLMENQQQAYLLN